METFIIKLLVAVLPLLILITVVNLSASWSLRRLQVVCRGRRTRTAVARACALGVMLR